jgi:molybdopterin-guanine dinucleotide biosynthesis protein A
VPRDAAQYHPLAAAYRTSVWPHVEQLLQSDRLRPVYLFSRVPTREVPVADLRAVDPDLRTLWNVNGPRDYAAALESAGLPLPPASPT